MIYFVRHGATDWNENINEKGERDPKIQGQTDIPLNSNGISQAIATSEKLKNIKFDRVLCSPLSRAIQTCKLIYKGDKKIEVDDRIIERNFGEFEGKTGKQFDFKLYFNANYSPKSTTVESIESMKNRLMSLLDELKEKPDDNVLIVSHGGVGYILLSFFRPLPENGDYSSFDIPNGKPLELDINKLL